MWKKQLKQEGGRLEALNDKSRAPKIKRQRLWTKEIIDKIKTIRQKYPNLGKDKIYLILNPWYKEHNLRCPSVTTIGRIIKDQGGLHIFPQKVTHFGKIKLLKRKKKLRKPKGFQPKYPGHLVAFDTIERFVDGCRRYVITFIDVYSRFTFAWATTSHTSKAAKEVLNYIQQVFPYPLEYILTDNGSEFMKEFEKALADKNIVHWHTYPKSPKMNTHTERFNRTIQEEFIDYHVSALKEPKKFNLKLMNYLIWYNTKRPHWALGLKSPIQFLLTNHPESKDRWSSTVPTQLKHGILIMGLNTKGIPRDTLLPNSARKTRLNRDLPELKPQGQTARQRG